MEKMHHSSSRDIPSSPTPSKTQQFIDIFSLLSRPRRKVATNTLSCGHATRRGNLTWNQTGVKSGPILLPLFVKYTILCFFFFSSAEVGRRTFGCVPENLITVGM